MESILEQIGLTPTESKVYLALLELGESKVGDILDRAKLNSGRIYDVLNSLKNRGLISSITKGSVKYFIPSPPDRVRELLKEKIKIVEKEQKDFENILPELSKRFEKLKLKTNVEVFLGVDGLKAAYSIFLKEGEKDKNLYIQGIISKEKYPEGLVNLLKYYIYKKRVELKLKTKKLISEEARKESLYSEDKSEIRYLPFPLITGIETLGEITLIEIQKEPIFTILIRNKEVTDDLKKQFELLWKSAES